MNDAQVHTETVILKPKDNQWVVCCTYIITNKIEARLDKTRGPNYFQGWLRIYANAIKPFDNKDDERDFSPNTVVESKLNEMDRVARLYISEGKYSPITHTPATYYI